MYKNSAKIHHNESPPFETKYNWILAEYWGLLAGLLINYWNDKTVSTSILQTCHPKTSQSNENKGKIQFVV